MSTYTELAKKYGDFTVPTYKISCNGKELKRSECTVTQIVVDNGMGETAGASRFTISHVYERGSRKINAATLNNLSPGTKVSVSLGYGSALTEVFCGYIDEMKTRFDQNEMTLSAICLDARGLMREGSAFAAAKDKKPADIVNAIFDKYGALITSKDVKLASFEEEVNITQAGADLEYVASFASSRGALFYIDCSKAVIGAAKSDVCVEFDWEQFAMDFTVRYLDEKLKAFGNNTRKMEAFSVEATAKQSAKQQKLVTVNRSIRVPHYMSKDSAKSHIDALGERKAASALFGTIYCAGLPDVKLGQKVKINKFPLADAGVSAKLTVVSFSHKLDNENGFLTEIGVEG